MFRYLPALQCSHTSYCSHYNTAVPGKICHLSGFFAFTGYSNLRSRPSSLPCESGTKRSETDKVIREKYDATKDADLVIIEHVNDLAEKYGVSMSEVALAWHYKKGVTAPIVGATKVSHFDQAV